MSRSEQTRQPSAYDTTSQGSVSRGVLAFDGKNYESLPALAFALCRSLDSAAAALDSRAGVYLAEVAELYDPEDPLVPILRRCASKTISTWRALVEIQLLVHGTVDVWVEGRQCSESGWIEALTDASLGEDARAQEWVWNLVEDDCFTPLLAILPETDARVRSWGRLPVIEDAARREMRRLSALADLAVDMPSAKGMRCALLRSLTSEQDEQEALADCVKMIRWYCDHVTAPCPVFRTECQAGLAGQLTLARGTVLSLVCRTSHGAQLAFVSREESLESLLKDASQARTDSEQSAWNEECWSYVQSVARIWVTWQGTVAFVLTVFCWRVVDEPNAVVFDLFVALVLTTGAIFGLGWLQIRRAPRRLSELNDDYVAVMFTLWALGWVLGLVFWPLGLPGGFPWWAPWALAVLVPLRLVLRGLGRAPTVTVKMPDPK